MAKTVKPKASNKIDIGHAPMLFNRRNYLLILIAVIVVAIGFIIMMGAKGNIYDSRRTVVAPIVVLLGFCIAGYAIFYKKKSQTSDPE